MRVSGTETTVPFYRVSHNYSTDTRIGVITVNAQAYTVTQQGYAATLDSESATIPASEMKNPAWVSFAVEKSADGTPIVWTAKTSNPWVTITPASGEGDGSVTYRVDANESDAERIAVLTIAGQRFVLTQEAAEQGGEAGGMQISLEPHLLTLSHLSTEKEIQISVDEDVSWSSISGAEWVKVIGTGSGRGNGILGIAIEENPSVLSRTCEVAIGDGKLTIVQKGTTDYRIGSEPAVEEFAYAGRESTFKVTANDDLDWTAICKDPWITFLPGSQIEQNGSGVTDLRYQVSLNTSLLARTGTVDFVTHIPYPEIDLARALTLWQGQNQNAKFAYDDSSIRDPAVKGETEGVWFVLTNSVHMNSLHRLFDLNNGSASLYVTEENRLVLDALDGEIVDLKFPVEVNVKYDLFVVSSDSETLIYGGLHDAGAYRQLYSSESVLKITSYGHTTKPSEDWLVWGETSGGAYYYWTRPLNGSEMVNIPQALPSISPSNESCYETLYNSFSFNGFRAWSGNKSPDGRVFPGDVHFSGDRFGLRQNAIEGDLCYNAITHVGCVFSVQDGRQKYSDVGHVARDSDGPPYSYYRYYNFCGDLKSMRGMWSYMVEGDGAYKDGPMTANLWLKIKNIPAENTDLFEVLRIDGKWGKMLNGKDIVGKFSPVDHYKLQFSEQGLTLVENGVFSPAFGAEYVKKDEWVMLTLASNGSKLTLYVNGVDVGNVLLSGSYLQFCPDCWCCYGEGNVVFDDVKTFTSCLSTEQIGQIYNLEKPLRAQHIVVQEAAVPTLLGESQECPSSGGHYTVSLTLPNRIKWTAESQADWVSITSATIGTGAATIEFDVAKNPETYERTGIITIAGLTYTIY